MRSMGSTMLIEWWMIVVLLLVLGIWAEYRHYRGVKDGRASMVQKSVEVIREEVLEAEQRITRAADERAETMSELVVREGRKEQVSPNLVIFLYTKALLNSGVITSDGEYLYGQGNTSLHLNKLGFEALLEAERLGLTGKKDPV